METEYNGTIRLLGGLAPIDGYENMPLVSYKNIFWDGANNADNEEFVTPIDYLVPNGLFSLLERNSKDFILGPINFSKRYFWSGLRRFNEDYRIQTSSYAAPFGVSVYGVTPIQKVDLSNVYNRLNRRYDYVPITKSDYYFTDETLMASYGDYETFISWIMKRDGFFIEGGSFYKGYSSFVDEICPDEQQQAGKDFRPPSQGYFQSDEEWEGPRAILAALTPAGRFIRNGNENALLNGKGTSITLGEGLSIKDNILTLDKASEPATEPVVTSSGLPDFVVVDEGEETLSILDTKTDSHNGSAPKMTLSAQGVVFSSILEDDGGPDADSLVIAPNALSYDRINIDPKIVADNGVVNIGDGLSVDLHYSVFRSLDPSSEEDSDFANRTWLRIGLSYERYLGVSYCAYNDEYYLPYDLTPMLGMTYNLGAIAKEAYYLYTTYNQDGNTILARLQPVMAFDNLADVDAELMTMTQQLWADMRDPVGYGNNYYAIKSLFCVGEKLYRISTGAKGFVVSEVTKSSMNYVFEEPSVLESSDTEKYYIATRHYDLYASKSERTVFRYEPSSDNDYDVIIANTYCKRKYLYSDAPLPVEKSSVQVEDPSDESDAVNKKYVDELIASLTARIEALENK